MIAALIKGSKAIRRAAVIGARLGGHAPEGMGRLRTVAGLAYHAKNGGIAGAGVGAAYGAITGMMDEDSSMIGGAIRGGIYGGAMGMVASRGLHSLRGKTGGMFPRTRVISPAYRENLSYWKAMDAENIRRYDDVAAPFVDDRSFYSDAPPSPKKKRAPRKKKAAVTESGSSAIDDFVRPTKRTGIPTSRNPVDFSSSPIFDHMGGRR